MGRASPREMDLLRVPALGRFLRWRHARTLLQATLLVAAVVILLDGLFGPELAPRNLAGVIPWVHWRGFVVLALLVAGNLFCMACPFMLPRRLAKRFLPADRELPPLLRSKGFAVALLIAFFWSYEAFALWESPWLTAWVILAYFALAFVVDGFFRGAAFCRAVCPIGQFHFVHAMASPLEVRVRDADVCGTCTTKDCIRGRYEAPLPLVTLTPRGTSGRALGAHGLLQGGCEMGLYLPKKVGNLDCTFCMECIHACPHENVGIVVRSPLQDLASDPVRAGVGRISARTDLSALAAVLVFGAWVNAFGMVEPIRRLEEGVAALFGVTSRAVIFAAVLLLALVLAPWALLHATAWGGRRLAGRTTPIPAEVRRHVWGLVPLGLAMWTAHYLFHLLIGGMALVPLLQEALRDLGIPAGSPAWTLGPMIPEGWIFPLQIGILQLGLLGSLLALWEIAKAVEPGRRRPARRGLVPWALLATVLALTGIWLLGQPMEMRGTLFVLASG
jgi:polyferredoxin